jgi:hypothetical protein
MSKCQATTLKGKPCSYNAKNGSFCGIHTPKASTSTDIVSNVPFTPKVEIVEMVYDGMEILRILKMRDENIIRVITNFMFSKEYIQNSIRWEYNLWFNSTHLNEYEICKTENSCYLKHTVVCEYVKCSFVKYVEFKMVGNNWVSVCGRFVLRLCNFGSNLYDIINPRRNILEIACCKANTQVHTTMIEDYMNTQDSNLKTLKNIYNNPKKERGLLKYIEDGGLLNSVKKYGSGKNWRFFYEYRMKREEELSQNTIKI